MGLTVRGSGGLGLNGQARWAAAVMASATLLAAGAGAAEPPRTAESPSESEDAGGLMEDEFSAIELFRNIHRLRPRFRLAQDWTIAQDFSGADVDTYRTSFRAQVVAPLSRRLAVRLLGSVAVNAYDFHGDGQFLQPGNSGEPFAELLATNLRLEGRYQLPYDFTLVGGATYRSGWERGASYGSGIQAGGFAGLGYIFRDRFSVIAAVATRTKIGRSSSLVVRPLVKIGFQITEKLEIESDGLGGKIAYRPIQPLTLFLRGTQDSDRYRLKNGDVVRDSKAPVVLGWSWRISKNWRFRGHLGAVVYQRWRVSKKNGDLIDQQTSRSPAFTGRLQIEYRF